MPAHVIALLTAICYACALVSARRGLKYSTPTTVTCVSVLVQIVMLWGALFLSRGVPRVSWTPVLLFAFVGVTQLGVRLLAYTGVHKIGASRSSALQATSPLIAAGIAILFLRERPSTEVILGTFLVVIGIMLVSWRAEEQIATFRWWHLLFPLGAACLTGMNHPIRRYALSLSNEPLFFSTVMGSASAVFFLAFMAASPPGDRLVWHRKALWPFLLTGIAETLSILFIVTALSVGSVVVVAPIAATYPVWALLGAALFLRDLERVNLMTVAGTLSVVVGTVAIYLGS